MQVVLASCSFEEDRDAYFNYLKKAYRRHWNHVRQRIIGKPIVLIPKHTKALIVIQLIALACLSLSFCFTLLAFKHFEITTAASIPRRFEFEIERENVSLTHQDTIWEELKKTGELALIGFYFIIVIQGLLAAFLFCASCYRCWSLKRPARPWELMPLCIGSTLLFLAGSLECYYATNFKKLDDEIPRDVKELWLVAGILTLVGAFLGILNTCLLLGSEAQIVGKVDENGEKLIV